MARLRTGHCSVAEFLHRHGLKGDDLCVQCAVVENVEHYFVCPDKSEHQGVMWRDLEEIVEKPLDAVLEVLRVDLMLGLQIRIANVIEIYLENTTEFGFL